MRIEETLIYSLQSAARGCLIARVRSLLARVFASVENKAHPDERWRIAPSNRSHHKSNWTRVPELQSLARELPARALSADCEERFSGPPVNPSLEGCDKNIPVFDAPENRSSQPSLFSVVTNGRVKQSFLTRVLIVIFTLL